MHQIRGMFWTLRCLRQPCVWRNTSTHSACGCTLRRLASPTRHRYACIDVRCRKAHSHSVQRRILLTRTWANSDVPTVMYGAISRRMSTQDSADGKIVTVIYCNMPHKLTSCTACCMRRRTMIQCVWKSSITTSPYVKVRRTVRNLLKAGNWALKSVAFMTQCAPHRPLPTGHHSNDLVPLHSGTLDSSRWRHCITQRRSTTATWYAGQLLPAVVLNVALIALLSLSSCSAWLPLSMSPMAFSATCWRQHSWLELCGISIFGGVIIAIRICHDTTSVSRYSIRYDISCHH